MSVILDGQPLPAEHYDPKITVGMAIERVKQSLPGPGVIIMGVRCDGTDISSENLGEVLPLPVTDFDRVEFISGRPKEVVLEALEQTRRSLASSLAIVKAASEELSKGNLAKGMADFVECIGIWGNIHEAIVQGGSLIGVDFEQLVIDGRHILDWLNDLAVKLRQAKEAVEARDHVSLCDILKYEVDEMLQGWEHMLNGFIVHIQAMDVGGTPAEDKRHPAGVGVPQVGG